MVSDANDDKGAGEKRRVPVLEVFGIKLEVSNPRLAELLTMDAREALTTDMYIARRKRDDPAPAVPDDDPCDPDPGEDEEAAERRLEFRRLVQDAGAALGFETGSDGLWLSPTGAAVVTRAVGGRVSFAQAVRCVADLSRKRASLAGEDGTALVVAEGQDAADVFKVAVRQEQLHDVVRVVAIDNLLKLRRLSEFGTLDHQQAVVLLVPMANIDVGEILSIMRASSVDEFPDVLR